MMVEARATSLASHRERLALTGHLGLVMKESAHAALTYLTSQAQHWGLEEKELTEQSFHIHFPEGGTPKDGPSAGVAIVAAMLSCLKRKPLRSDICMTGEITLSGHVLGIGGLIEKILAAHRHQKVHVMIPRENLRELRELPDEVRKEMNIIPVSTLDEAMMMLELIDWKLDAQDLRPSRFKK